MTRAIVPTNAIEGDRHRGRVSRSIATTGRRSAISLPRTTARAAVTLIQPADPEPFLVVPNSLVIVVYAMLTTTDQH